MALTNHGREDNGGCFGISMDWCNRDLNQNGAAYQSIAAWQPLSNRKRGLVLFLTVEKILTKVA